MIASDEDECSMPSKDLDDFKDVTSHLILIIGEKEVKSSFEVKEDEKEDVMSQFSNDEEGLLWIGFNEE